MLTMAFNWGRAALGTIPFVTFGARYGGVQGGLVGVALGSAVFGLLAVGTTYLATARPAKKDCRRYDRISPPEEADQNARRDKDAQRGCASCAARGLHGKALAILA